jgi:hypothetical protein
MIKENLLEGSVYGYLGFKIKKGEFMNDEKKLEFCIQKEDYEKFKKIAHLNNELFYAFLKKVLCEYLKLYENKLIK